MSKAGLLIQCTWPFRNDAVLKVTANDPMRYGSAFHELVAISLQLGAPAKMNMDDLPRIAERYDISASELSHHASSAYGELRLWLSGNNPWHINFLPLPKNGLVVEQAIAYDTQERTARMVPPVDEHHVYQDLGPYEHPGTVDLALNLKAYGPRVPPRLRKAALILDHKTGMEIDMPGESAQLRSLAVAFCSLWKCDRAILAINHAPRDGIPAVFADEVGPDILAEHADKLAVAFERIGDGSLRPGPECGYCAGNSVCPAYGGSLAGLSRDLMRMGGGGSGAAGSESAPPVVSEAHKALSANATRLDIETPEGRGDVHMILQMMRKMDEFWTEKLKEKLRQEGPDSFGLRRDGQLTVLKTVERDNLSLASIRRAFTKPGEAAKIEKMLRDAGAVEKIPREELRAVRDR